jgi:hypothetical protein
MLKSLIAQLAVILIACLASPQSHALELPKVKASCFDKGIVQANVVSPVEKDFKFGDVGIICDGENNESARLYNVYVTIIQSTVPALNKGKPRSPLC